VVAATSARLVLGVATLVASLVSTGCFGRGRAQDAVAAPSGLGVLGVGIGSPDAGGASEGSTAGDDDGSDEPEPRQDPDAPLPPITFRDPMPASVDARAPASMYAAFAASRCKAEVKRRELPVAPIKSAQRGVVTGMRLTGAMNGVRLVAPPSSTKFGVLDCRMALVLDDLTKALREAGVVRVSIDNIYRPNAKLPGRKKSSQHAHGLAIDVTAFELSDGRVLSTSMWGASIGEVPCGPDAAMASPTADAVTVRNLVCAIGRAGFFHSMLTPSYDAAHQSHFHFDIKVDASRMAVR
jgi:hypothetical protein